ncbi:MAG: colanic acid biosynthesis glycosyltransferase WcaI [Sphingopyxis sp.]|nr:MAG: colanic acid biosynthesis glycosyltransferase WcaI [Sphingopyxis sp.]
MKIALFSINFSPDLTGIGYYSGAMATELMQRGHQLTVFAAPPFYPEWKIRKGYRNWWWSREVVGGVTVYRCPTFIPSQPSGLTRLLHYGSFALTAFLATIWMRFFSRPDIVFNVAPALFSSIPAVFLAKISNAKSWLHVQDFEVEAGFATGQMRGDNMVGKFAMAFERRMINFFDYVSSISAEMCRKLAEKGRDEKSIFELRNWSDVDAVFPMNDSSFRSLWGIEEPYVALFSGSITRKQGMEVIVDCARLLKGRDDIAFVICGAGPLRESLERRASDLPNCRFYDLQPYDSLNELLALATVHLLPQKADAADLVLPSKLTNMLASGRPIIAGAAAGTGLAREIENCGVNVEPENPHALAAALEHMIENRESYDKMARCARERAINFWRKTSIIDALEKNLLEVVND